MMKFFYGRIEGFLYDWQTLIGAALGPFLAVVVTVWIEGKRERKESLRRIEISITQGLHDTYSVREQLKAFVQRIKDLMTKLRAETNNNMIYLDRINFPTLREVYRDINVPTFKVRSYYIHNKLLWADAGIKEMNKILSNLKNDFEDLIRLDEKLIDLMRDNPDPSNQRRAYVDNLEKFAGVIEEYISKDIPQAIKIMVQIKFYNGQLGGRRDYSYWFWWKHEGTSFKYFRNRTEWKKFARNIDSIERIDNEIQKEVESLIIKAEERVIKLSEK